MSGGDGAGGLQPPRDEARTTVLHSQMPFTEELDVEVLSATPEEVVARSHWAPERCTVGGVLHGGFLMAVSDSIGAACSVHHLPSGTATSTIESKTNFFGPVKRGSLRFVAVPVHVGRTTIVVQTDCFREDGKLVSRTIQTQAVLRPR
jgi:uncharacterized protein (TIGR00369 family)